MDRISNLPNELRLHIISLLTTKEAISTSLLSKKWEKIWVNLQRIDISVESSSSIPNVNRILDRLQSSLISIHLQSSQKLRPGVVTNWINNSVRLNAQEIQINVFAIEIPSILFSCVSLTHLDLHSTICGSITVPNDFCFPNVKSLVFTVSGPPKQLTKKLFRNCPKLEKLELGGMRDFKAQVYHKDLVYDISCPLLKILDISFWGGNISNATTPLIFLNTPNLESLEIEEKFGLQFVVQGSCAPVNAIICLFNCCYDMLPIEDVNRAYTLLKWINGVKYLALDEAMTYALSVSHVNNNVPFLPNLTRLHLKIPRLCDWTLLFNIIKNSPNLRALTIEKACDHYDASSLSEMRLPQDFDWTEPNFPAKCLESNLEEIILTGFFWMGYDLMAIKYLLGNAKVLKEFRASPHRLGLKREGLFWKLLEQYAKASPCTYVVPKIDSLTGLTIV